MAADKPAGEVPTPGVLKLWDTQGWADPGAELVGTRGRLESGCAFLSPGLSHGRPKRESLGPRSIGFFYPSAV